MESGSQEIMLLIQKAVILTFVTYFQIRFWSSIEVNIHTAVISLEMKVFSSYLI